MDEGAGSNSLLVSEYFATTGDNIGITSGGIFSSVRSFVVYYSATGGTFGGGITVLTGSGNDTVTVYSQAAGAPLIVSTGAGNDGVEVVCTSASPYSGLYVDMGAGTDYLLVVAYGATTQDFPSGSGGGSYLATFPGVSASLFGYAGVEGVFRIG